MRFLGNESELGLRSEDGCSAMSVNMGFGQKQPTVILFLFSLNGLCCQPLPSQGLQTTATTIATTSKTTATPNKEGSEREISTTESSLSPPIVFNVDLRVDIDINTVVIVIAVAIVIIVIIFTATVAILVLNFRCRCKSQSPLSPLPSSTLPSRTTTSSSLETLSETSPPLEM